MHFDPVLHTVELIRGFRSHFGRQGHREHGRRTLVARHDSTVRFTNSTISVLKPELFRPRGVESLLLVQPALRLRNLTHWRRHASVSGFGCYFVALGTLGPPDSLAATQKSVVSWLIDVVGVPRHRLVIRGCALDVDLLSVAAPTGVALEVDGCPIRTYRHTFGLTGVRGRNTNLAIRTRGGLADVGNLILIERDDGTPLAVESAFGVNTVLARVHDLGHVLLASPVARGAIPPPDLMAIDAAGSAIPLLAEGLRPRARGRAGNLRALLSVLAGRIQALGWSDRDVSAWLAVAVEADHLVREHLSPSEDTEPDLSVDDTLRRLMVDLSLVEAA